MSSEKKISTEIVIVGGGGAGMAAALTAAEMGCSNIVVLEKAGIGGNSALAHDIFGAESPVQTQMGMDAQKDDFFKIAMEWAHWSKINPRIVRAFIDKSGDTIRWLQSHGLRFELGQYFINQVPRVRHIIEGEGAKLMKVLAEKCQANGVKVLKATTAMQLVHNKNGGVNGVVANSKGEKITIEAKSVIMATGGYAANKELLAKHCEYYNPDVNLSHGVRGNRGDGIRMATEMGAATAGLGHIMFHGPHVPRGAKAKMKIGGDGEEIRNYPLSILIREPETLWINKRGQRFIDEGHNLSSFASAVPVAQQPGGIMYTLFDDGIRQRMEEKGIIWPGAYGGSQRETSKHIRPLAGEPLPGLGRELQAIAEKSAAIKIAESMDNIASWIGANPELLKRTVEEYNACCHAGHDSIFSKDRRNLLPLEKAPYYAIRGQALICDAIGGIKINEKMEVVDAKDNPIPGLYAAGSTTGGWESENYCYRLTGHLLGFAINSGRIAGENAVRYSSI